MVTEKMSTDMLEMILNKSSSRLSERVSKFIIYQVIKRTLIIAITLDYLIIYKKN